MLKLFDHKRTRSRQETELLLEEVEVKEEATALIFRLLLIELSLEDELVDILSE